MDQETLIAWFETIKKWRKREKKARKHIYQNYHSKVIAYAAILPYHQRKDKSRSSSPHFNFKTGREATDLPQIEDSIKFFSASTNEIWRP